jgi:hypothetical protein
VRAVKQAAARNDGAKLRQIEDKGTPLASSATLSKPAISV